MSKWICMNLIGQSHSLNFVKGHLESTVSIFFSLETARPIEAKFHMDPSRDRGMEVCSNG